MKGSDVYTNRAFTSLGETVNMESLIHSERWHTEEWRTLRNLVSSLPCSTQEEGSFISFQETGPVNSMNWIEQARSSHHPVTRTRHACKRDAASLRRNRYWERRAPRATQKRNLRSKIWWFTESCNSHYVSHFAAFFIVARAKISIAKSCTFFMFELTNEAKWIASKISQLAKYQVESLSCQRLTDREVK